MTAVLIVEDDEVFRSSLERDLRMQGMQVIACSGADDALRLLSTHDVSVIVTDLRMSGLDGIDLLDRLRDMKHRARAILISAFASARDYQTATEMGAVRVLCKPFTSSELTEAIRQAEECDTGFRGSIHGLGLVDLLQMLHFGRRSVVVRIGGTVIPGAIYLRDGEIIHARNGATEGTEALRELLGLPVGMLRTEALPPDVQTTVDMSFGAVVLDCLRQIDEITGRFAVLDAAKLDAAPEAPAEPLGTRWVTAWAALPGMAPECLVVAAVSETRGVALGASDATLVDRCIATTRALTDAASRLTGRARRGVVDCSGGEALVLGLWDEDHELLAMVADDTARSSAQRAWVRAATLAVTRQLLGAEWP